MNYNSNLKTWGAVGVEYPDAYSYKAGERPIDDWDNFVQHNIIEDIKHLIGATNDDLLLRNGGSLLSDLTVGDYGLDGTAGSVDFGGTEITIDGTVDLLQSLDVGGSITVTGTVDGVDLGLLKTNFDSHETDTTNPHSVTAAQVGAYTESETQTWVNGNADVPNSDHSDETDSIRVLVSSPTTPTNGEIWMLE